MYFLILLVSPLIHRTVPEETEEAAFKRQALLIKKELMVPACYMRRELEPCGNIVSIINMLQFGEMSVFKKSLQCLSVARNGSKKTHCLWTRATERPWKMTHTSTPTWCAILLCILCKDEEGLIFQTCYTVYQVEYTIGSFTLGSVLVQFLSLKKH